MPDMFNWFANLTFEYAKELTGMDLDRFSQGCPDPQDAPVVDYCNACGGEIYPGEVHQDTITSKLYCEPECAPVDADLVLIDINRQGEIGA